MIDFSPGDRVHLSNSPGITGTVMGHSEEYPGAFTVLWDSDTEKNPPALVVSTQEPGPTK